MTPIEQKRFDRLATAIRRISSYSTPSQLRREYGGSDAGIDYAEALEYAYENIRNEARAVVSLVHLKRSKSPSVGEAPSPESSPTVNDADQKARSDA